MEVDEHSLNYFLAERDAEEEYIAVLCECDQCGCGFKGWVVCAVGSYPEFCPQCGMDCRGCGGSGLEHKWIRGADTKRMQWGTHKLCTECGRLKDFPNEEVDTG